MNLWLWNSSQRHSDNLCHSTLGSIRSSRWRSSMVRLELKLGYMCSGCDHHKCCLGSIWLEW